MKRSAGSLTKGDAGSYVRWWVLFDQGRAGITEIDSGLYLIKDINHTGSLVTITTPDRDFTFPTNFLVETVSTGLPRINE